jgi:hypothetical protein
MFVHREFLTLPSVEGVAVRTRIVLSCVAVASFFLSAADELPPAEGAAALRYWYPLPAENPPKVIEADLIVYGASPAGVTAAVQAQRMGKKAVVAEFGNHVGGLTSGGLSATDVGNRESIGGMANEFYAKVGVLRGFKPSAAEKAFREMLQESGAEVMELQRLKEVKKEGNHIVELVMENGNVFRGKIFLDASYEGDLMARAKVTYTYGREANAQYGETIDGVQYHNGHNFVRPTDPYIKDGDPASGLLPLISADVPPAAGAGDKRIQAYNFRMYLANTADRVAFPKPAHYDPSRYALLARYLKLHPIPPVQLHVGDCNNEGAFSTDNIGKNWDWPDASYAQREAIFQEHVNYQQGFMYFIQHDESVAERIRAEVAKWGLAVGEFSTTGSWPHQLYIREARRMVSDYVMTENHCMRKVMPEDSVGLGSYNMDSHNCERVVVNGTVRNEGDVQIHPPHPYPISYRSIVPRESECDNLFVPVALSCTHIAYGSIRMEPVFMMLGQSAGTAAVMAIDGKTSVQKVDYEKLKTRLIADKQILTWTVSEREKATDATRMRGGAIALTDLKGVVVDDTDAIKTGDWRVSGASGAFVGTGYIHDNNEQKGQKKVRFETTLAKGGEYEVRMSYGALKNRATNVPVTVWAGGQAHGVKVNEQVPAECEYNFHLLGKFTFATGEKAAVEIGNEGTDGHVIVDAVQWLPSEEKK